MSFKSEAHRRWWFAVGRYEANELSQSADNEREALQSEQQFFKESSYIDAQNALSTAAADRANFRNTELKKIRSGFDAGLYDRAAYERKLSILAEYDSVSRKIY